MFVIPTNAPESKQVSTFENLDFRNKNSQKLQELEMKIKNNFVMTLVGRSQTCGTGKFLEIVMKFYSTDEYWKVWLISINSNRTMDFWAGAELSTR
jgi:ABC-type phosphate transport system ATPase subunit